MMMDEQVPRFLEGDVARRWLDRFLDTDREIAANLIDEMLLVRRALTRNRSRTVLPFRCYRCLSLLRLSLIQRHVCARINSRRFP